MIRRLFLLLGLLSISASGAEAQTITGVVVDAEAAETVGGVERRIPVAGAEVELLTEGGDEVTRTITDSLGRFQAAAPEAGGFRLRVSHLAYVTYNTERVQIGLAETLSIEIRLGRSVIPLEPLVVTARTNTSMAPFHERRTGSALGTFLTREEIEARAAGQTTDLLRGLPGVRIHFVRWGVGPAIEMQGGFGPCEPAIFVDGIRAPQTQGNSLNDFLTPERIEGVELYSSISTVPAQYHSGTCGVILFWTRRGGREGGEPWGWKRVLLGLGIAVGLILWIR